LSADFAQWINWQIDTIYQCLQPADSCIAAATITGSFRISMHHDT
jgi:hypothetical protein